MEYEDYIKLYHRAVDCGLRQEYEEASEEDWMQLATVTQDQMVETIRKDLTNE